MVQRSLWRGATRRSVSARRTRLSPRRGRTSVGALGTPSRRGGSTVSSRRRGSPCTGSTKHSRTRHGRGCECMMSAPTRSSTRRASRSCGTDASATHSRSTATSRLQGSRSCGHSVSHESGMTSLACARPAPSRWRGDVDGARAFRRRVGAASRQGSRLALRPEPRGRRRATATVVHEASADACEIQLLVPPFQVFESLVSRTCP